ncbi:MAG: flavoprotein [bacterium]|jgi:phosphopantothenoylcysteine decarboxylase/phosphopantothenate--cysteine ligase|nr:flavoprotein [bacterium]
MNLADKHILYGVTGGIAAYKAALLVRLFKKAGADVRVVMTASATQFITPLTMGTLSENPVGLDMFQQQPIHDVRHIRWADWADLALIAPATANTIGKIANGIADDLLSSMVLAIQCPLIIAPAMHHQMWAHPAVQRNLETLKQFGYLMIEPGQGALASGDTGVGRMQDPEAIFQFIQALDIP